MITVNDLNKRSQEAYYRYWQARVEQKEWMMDIAAVDFCNFQKSRSSQVITREGIVEAVSRELGLSVGIILVILHGKGISTFSGGGWGEQYRKP